MKVKGTHTYIGADNKQEPVRKDIELDILGFDNLNLTGKNIDEFYVALYFNNAEDVVTTGEVGELADYKFNNVSAFYNGYANGPEHIREINIRLEDTDNYYNRNIITVTVSTMNGATEEFVNQLWNELDSIVEAETGSSIDDNLGAEKEKADQRRAQAEEDELKITGEYPQDVIDEAQKIFDTCKLEGADIHIDNNGVSVLVKDTVNNIGFWFDIFPSKEGDLEGDWNKYIFQNNFQDRVESALQNNGRFFEAVFEVAEDYAMEKEAIVWNNETNKYEFKTESKKTNKTGIGRYLKEDFYDGDGDYDEADWEEEAMGEEREDVEEYIISFEPGELYDRYGGEFITEDKEEADDLFDEIREEHKLDQVDQYIRKVWEWDRVNEEYYETDVDVYFNAGDELEYYDESKKVESVEEDYKDLPKLPNDLYKRVQQIKINYDENIGNEEDDVFAGTVDSYANENLDDELGQLIFTNKPDYLKIYIWDNFDTTTRDLQNEVEEFIFKKLKDAIVNNTLSKYKKAGKKTENKDDDKKTAEQFDKDLDGIKETLKEIVSILKDDKENKKEEDKSAFNKQELTSVRDSIKKALDGLQLTSQGTAGDYEDRALRDDLRNVGNFLDRYLVRIGESKKVTEAKPEEADKEIWEKVEKIVDTADSELGPDQSAEYDYDEHIRFVIYRDFEYEDIFEVYTCVDEEVIDDLDTGDVHLEDLDATLVGIVKKLTNKDVKTEAVDNEDVLIVNVYQIQDVENCDYAFMNYEVAKSKGGPDLKDYKKVAEFGISNALQGRDVETILDMAFTYGNIKDDYFKYNPGARSISVSDILEYNGEKYYVDATGFEKLDKGVKTESRYTVYDYADGDTMQDEEEKGLEPSQFTIYDNEVDDFYYDELGNNPVFDKEEDAEEYIKKNLTEATNKKYTHWLKLRGYRSDWVKLRDYYNNYNCEMNVYHKNNLIDYYVELICDQSYDELDLDVNSLESDIERLQSKPSGLQKVGCSLESLFNRFDNKMYENKEVKTEAKRSNKQLDYKLDGFKGVNIIVVDKKNGIDTEKYLEFDSMEFGIDEYEFKISMADGIENILKDTYEYSDVYYDDIFTEDEIDEMARDITQDVLQLYDDLPEDRIDRKNVYANLGESKKVEAKDLYGEWLDLLDKIPADKLEDYMIEYDLYDEQLNGDVKPTEMILPKLIAGARKYINTNLAEASLNKFQTLTLDKNGNEMLLKDTSYNHACSWLEKELAKTGSKVVDTETKGNKTIIKADNKTKFEYDEEKGTLKRLEEVVSDNIPWESADNVLELLYGNTVYATCTKQEYADNPDKYKQEVVRSVMRYENTDKSEDEILNSITVRPESKGVKTEAIDPEAVKEKVKKAKADIGLKQAEEMVDTENELTDGIKKEIIQYAKQQGLDVEKLQKQGQLNTVAEALDNIVGEMVSKSANEFMDTTGKNIEWDFEVKDNNINVIWNEV